MAKFHEIYPLIKLIKDSSYCISNNDSLSNNSQYGGRGVEFSKNSPRVENSMKRDS